MSDKAESEDTDTVVSPLRKETAAPSMPADRKDPQQLESGDGAPAAGDLIALAVESAVAMGVRAARLGFWATSKFVAAADRLGGARLTRRAARILAGALEGPAREGRDDIESMVEIAERQLTRVAAVTVPVVVDSIDVDTVLERIDIEQLMARIDVNDVLEQVDIDRLLARVDVNALMDRVDIWKLVDPAVLGEILAEQTDRMAEWNADFAKRQATGLETVVNRAVDRVRSAHRSSLPAGSHLHGERDDSGSI